MTIYPVTAYNSLLCLHKASKDVTGDRVDAGGTVFIKASDSILKSELTR